jgi:hypothetical protein
VCNFPAGQKIYHITHVDNLPSIIADGAVFSDAKLIADGKLRTNIGMSRIKQRRLATPMGYHPGDKVGDYVPFNFCSRSVMLFVIACRNHADLPYDGGQAPIVHLEADLAAVIAAVEQGGRRWAFSTRNASALYNAAFYSGVEDLKRVSWQSVANHDFRDVAVQESKQAEFLIREFVPWTLVERIGVRTNDIAERVKAALADAAHKPEVVVKPDWYFAGRG